jgi:predicted house-cleaning noncanonical NTP pyrophosphatase (MazG superfamily)
MKKRNPISEGMLSRFVDNIFTNIKNNNRARNIKALKTDPQLKKAEAKLADAYEEFFAYAKKQGHLPG